MLIRAVSCLVLIVTTGCASVASTGMNAEVLGRIPERMRGFVAEKQVAGVVTLVARRGRTVHLEAVGQANVEQDRPMRTDALFAIASMTKPIVAVAVMILQDEGKLSVDDPVSKYIPRFKAAALKDGPAEREITIRDLLTHTSGFGGEQRTEETLEATTAEIAGRPLQFQPGTQWAYSPGLNVCGRIIELVSGQAFDAFLAERVFRPLNMVDTTFQPTAELRDRLAQLYEPGPDGESLASGTHWIITDPGRRAPNPSGGLFSTASDVARFGQMILNGGKLDGRRIVSKAAIEQMCRVQTGDLTTGFSPGCGWGLGWCVVRQPQEVTRMLSPGTFGHGGAFGTQYWIDPEREMIFVLMIQRRGFGSGDRSEIRDVFQELAVRAVRD